jgi:hypothetical protein
LGSEHSEAWAVALGGNTRRGLSVMVADLAGGKWDSLLVAAGGAAALAGAAALGS